MSSGLILKMNNGYNGGEQSTREVRYVKGKMFLYPPARMVHGLL
jgi:hypothetical protein